MSKGVTILLSFLLMLTALPTIVFAQEQTATLTIDAPVSGSIVDVGTVAVFGSASGLDDSPLTVQALDAGGTVIDQQTVTVAPQPDGSGIWQATLNVNVTPGTPGSISVFAQSPADGSMLAQASAAVTFGQAEIEQPTAPVEPVAPVQPVEPTPEEPVEPAQPVAPVQPIQPVEPTPEQPIEPVQPIQPIEPTPEQPIEPPIPQPGLRIDIPLAGEIVSPVEVVVVGTGTALPENNVVVQVQDGNGRVVAEESTIVDAPLGGTGEWRATLRPNLQPGTMGSIFAFSTSPADGRIVASDSINVTFGEAEPEPTPPPVEAAVTIDIPQPGEVVSPAEVVVVGTGVGLPENNVVVQALDSRDRVLDEAATTVDAELGGTGEWRITLRPDAVPGTPGRIVAFSRSPADGRIVASDSTNIGYGSGPVPTPPPARPEVTITIPGNGETVSPAEVVVVGVGTALPENNVVVRALDSRGRILAEAATVVDAELGGTGEWRVTLRPNAVSGSTGRLYAFSPSPADGSTVASATVDVTYGQAQPQPVVQITQPVEGARLNTERGVTVAGYAANIFENNVVVRVLDSRGVQVASAATTADHNGHWAITLNVGSLNGPGVIIAYSPSPAGGTLAQDRVNVYFSATPTPQPPSITIRAPANGSRVNTTQPFVVRGTARNLFEGNVLVRVRDNFGRTLRQTVTTADLGGNWSVSFGMLIANGTPGSIYAFSTSPVDGSVAADDLVRVTFVSNCAVRTDWPIYTVQPGDTLFSIAQRTGSSIEELIFANCLTNPNVIYVGQALRVPQLPGQPLPPQPPSITIDEPEGGAELARNTPFVVNGTAAGIVPGIVFVRALDSSGNVLEQRRVDVVGVDERTGEWEWEAELLARDLPPGARGLLYAYAVSPTDGSIEATDVVDVVYGTDDGQSAYLLIDAPLPYSSIDTSENVLVSGAGRGLFEGNVVVQVIGAAGQILLTQPTILSTETVGGEGRWEVELPVDYVGRGRIVAFSPSPVDGSRMAESAVDVLLGDITDQPSYALITYPLPNSVVTNQTPFVYITGFARGVDPSGVFLIVTTREGFIRALLPLEVDPTTGFWSFAAESDLQIDADEALFVRVVATEPGAGRTHVSDQIQIMTRTDDAVVTGTVNYLVRSALPDDAVVKVQIVNASLADAPPEKTLLGEQVIMQPGQVPIPFAVGYDTLKVEENALYSVKVRIEDGQGNLLFISTQVVPVITLGNPTSDVEVFVDPV